MSAQRVAAVAGTELDEQWRSIDSVLDTLAQRSRARRGSDEEELEEKPLRAAPRSKAVEEQLRLRLEAAVAERDRLAERLALTERRLRSARAAIRRLEQAPAPAAPVTEGRVPTIWLRAVRRRLHRRRPG